MYSKGISEEEMNSARAAYTILASDPSDGKVVLIRKTLFRSAYAVYKQDFHPTNVKFVEILSKLFQTCS